MRREHVKALKTAGIIVILIVIIFYLIQYLND